MEWAKILEAGAMIGQRPEHTLGQTLPELKLAMRGWQRAHGIDPDAQRNTKPMSYGRLMELAGKYSKHEYT